MAAKKYYFGVGGGTRQFLSMIEKDGKNDLFSTYLYNDDLYPCTKMASI